jgi:predicted nucleic acid-binding protein
MIVVSDTTALTTLIKSGFDWMLPRLFGEILIPSAVADELLQFHPTLPAWCIVRAATLSPLLDHLREAVDLGEAEAIALAHELQANLVLLDDKKGRRQAEAIGLSCLALPGVLVAAKRQGLIPSVAAAFETIAMQGRYRVADSAALILLRSVGEA